MHKSDYEAIARAIKENSFVKGETDFEDNPYGSIILYHTFLHDLCDILKADNPRFDADKFREACK